MELFNVLMLAVLFVIATCTTIWTVLVLLFLNAIGEGVEKAEAKEAGLDG